MAGPGPAGGRAQESLRWLSCGAPSRGVSPFSRRSLPSCEGGGGVFRPRHDDGADARLDRHLAGQFPNDPLALARVFEAKRRPAFDPLIIHIASLSTLDRIADLGALSPAAREKALRLAAVIPAPRVRQPARMGWYARVIDGRMRQMGW